MRRALYMSYYLHITMFVLTYRFVTYTMLLKQMCWFVKISTDLQPLCMLIDLRNSVNDILHDNHSDDHYAVVAVADVEVPVNDESGFMNECMYIDTNRNRIQALCI